MIAPQRSHTGVEETRLRILAAARDIFEANGTKGTTTREIAERAGVNEATLFRHFGSKATLLAEMRSEACGFEQFRSIMTTLTGEDIAADLKRVAHNSIARMMTQRALMSISLGEEAHIETPSMDGPEWRGPRQMMELLASYLAERVAEGRLNGQPELLARVLMGMMFQLVVARKLWAGYENNMPVDTLVEIFLHGVEA